MIKSANISATGDGDNTVVAAVAGKRIVVVSMTVVAWHATAADSCLVRSGSAGTTMANYRSGLTNAPSVVTFPGTKEAPAFECDMGQGLVVANGAGVDTLGWVNYFLR